MINGKVMSEMCIRDRLDMFYEAQYNDAAALNPNLTTADEIHKAVNWWISVSYTHLDVYKRQPLLRCLSMNCGWGMAVDYGVLASRKIVWSPLPVKR